ncbi:MAG: Tn3 family transposase [Symplocastrum torsivum CPER-KK1]|jgi:TnpA family transposase|uniref:Tn3 family transposase n=1 Tax=Symplocastrum torsivum CPER-KK1 TaxID=450513 RepID=A0A951PRS0_9CYAN|nr:Tn3 family transposase [Symplocastrum torsivum CPER-KK1]
MVKPHWDTEELVENWTLLPQELERVNKKVGANQIGFAILLKSFQLVARFPDSDAEIPDLIISYIASQLKIDPNLYSQYNWQGRSLKNHRAEIRQLFGFRTATLSDSEEMSNWLIENILPNEQRFEPLLQLIYQRFRELQIEPPTPQQVERLTRSAIHQHETKFCNQIFSQLTPTNIEQIDLLLTTEETNNIEKADSEKLQGKLKASDLAFAFTHLLGFQLMPRLKRIKTQKLYHPYTGHSDAYPNLQPILTRPINWDLIRQQYDQMVKYATALRLGTAETEAILKRFSKNPIIHPTYLALLELGRVIKTIFLCQYLEEEAVRREVNEGLNVVERWNGVNDFIFYGKGGEFASNRLETQELSVLSLHLLQICLVYVNTLMIQSVLAQKHWEQKLTATDLRAITPLIFSHVNPYGTFKLDMTERIARLTQLSVA